MAKKATGKSIREKRMEKKAKNDHASQMENLTHGKKSGPPTGQPLLMGRLTGDVPRASRSPVAVSRAVVTCAARRR
ncbi:hypothetical protein QOZ88_14825 [Blastococcus sp. BMG 814]|uniref:Uncharacterized protein n=1 Tax=Blastococcus carthaginiensis TaxID=3050034 RepID=A0ABT9IFP7_9ACTN|nr:hypothetical protein [Blastococcus carthaginiensis]MDP5183910.1 hypothetical protein [Blastococcus carthaginiensis]